MKKSRECVVVVLMRLVGEFLLLTRCLSKNFKEVKVGVFQIFGKKRYQVQGRVNVNIFFQVFEVKEGFGSDIIDKNFLELENMNLLKVFVFKEFKIQEKQKEVI